MVKMIIHCFFSLPKYLIIIIININTSPFYCISHRPAEGGASLLQRLQQRLLCHLNRL